MCFWYVLAGCLQEVVEAKNSIATFEATFKATEAKKKVEKKKKNLPLVGFEPGTTASKSSRETITLTLTTYEPVS